MLLDAQDLADALLDAESKLGQMLEAIPTKRKQGEGVGPGSAPSLPNGIPPKESHYAQEIARNPETVEKVKAAATVKGAVIHRQPPLSLCPRELTKKSFLPSAEVCLHCLVEFHPRKAGADA